MSGINFGFPLVGDIPIPEDGVSRGKISAQGINAYIEVNGVILGGSYSFDTVTITLKGITTPPFSSPSKTGLGSSFSYDGKTWTIIDVVPGAYFFIGGTKKYFSWSVTGVDMTSGRAQIA